MEVQEYHPPTKFICEKIKFLNRQLSARPIVFRAEITVEVTYVGYLYIAAINQVYLLFYYLFANAHQAKSKFLFTVLLAKLQKIFFFPVFFLVYSFSFVTFASIIS